MTSEEQVLTLREMLIREVRAREAAEAENAELRGKHKLPPAYSALAVRLMLDEMRQNLILIAQAVQDIVRELREARTEG